LSQALRQFAHVCGQEVVFTEDMVAGQATSLKGEYTVQGALDRLLQGTDLVAERSTSGAIMIRRRLRQTGADARAADPWENGFCRDTAGQHRGLLGGGYSLPEQVT
jgi:hypothetical protein